MIFERTDGDLTVTYNQSNMREIERQLTVDHLDTQEGRFYGVFDEFGDEGLPWKGLEVFTLSGCCFLGDLRRTTFNDDWRVLRERVFKLGPTSGFHALKHFPKVRPKGIDELIEFIIKHPIKFISRVVEAKINLSRQKERHFAVLDSLLSAVETASSSLFTEPVDRDEWYFEHSKRLSPRLMMSHRNPRYRNSASHGGIYFISKNSREPILELADLVNYIVGKYSISLIRGSKIKHENLISAMFSPGKGDFAKIVAIFGPIFIPVNECVPEE